MIAHRFLLAAFMVGLFAPHSAFALDWEIERNFRYFLYPSDVARSGLRATSMLRGKARPRRRNNLKT